MIAVLACGGLMWGVLVPLAFYRNAVESDAMSQRLNEWAADLERRRTGK